MLYNGKNEPCIRKAPYQPGDILYVRETWSWCPCWDCGMDAVQGGCEHEATRRYNGEKREHGCYMYRASCEDNEYPPADTWHPSIHMPKEAARIWLKVTDVRVERLQEIALEDWKILWDSTIKKSDLDSYGWDANPWLWVIEFDRCKKPGECN